MKNLFYILVHFLLIAGLTADANLFAQNYALEFDGTNDAVSLSNSTSFQSVSSALTIEAWVKADEFKNEDVVFMANSRYSMQFTASGAITTGIYIGGWNSGTSSSTVTVSNWKHVALTYNGDNIHFYINGVAAGITDIANGTITANNSSPLSIGANYDANANYFNGKMDEVRIWNIARTQTEIQNNMNKELAGNESGLVAYYKMSNGSGVTLTDNSSNSNTGAIAGATWVLANDLSLPVSISSFSARPEGRSIILEWVAESESDNLGFIIERSSINNDWLTIATYMTSEALKSRGNTSSRAKYIFIDMGVESGLTYAYRLSDVNTEGKITQHTSLSIKLNTLPELTEMQNAFPNPFNPETRIGYKLAKSGRVNIVVYDMLGRKVRTLVDSRQTAGSYNIFWNGKDEKGTRAATGSYLVVLKTADGTKTQKVSIVK